MTPMRDFERVYTMTDFYDGPRAGIASVHGRPHAYSSLFDPDAPGLFELRPVDDDTLRLALEDWEIWLRWENAFHAGETTIETHPALPADRARYDEIARLLAARLVAVAGPTIRATAEFRPSPGHEHADRGRWLEARWTIVG